MANHTAWDQFILHHGLHEMMETLNPTKVDCKRYYFNNIGKRDSLQHTPSDQFLTGKKEVAWPQSTEYSVLVQMPVCITILQLQHELSEVMTGVNFASMEIVTEPVEKKIEDAFGEEEDDKGQILEGILEQPTISSLSSNNSSTTWKTDAINVQNCPVLSTMAGDDKMMVLHIIK